MPLSSRATLNLRASNRTLPDMGDSFPAMVDLRWDAKGGHSISWPQAPGAHDRLLSSTEADRLRRLADEVATTERGGRGVPVARAVLEALDDGTASR